MNPLHLIHRLIQTWDAALIVWGLMEYPRPGRLSVFLAVWNYKPSTKGV